MGFHLQSVTKLFALTLSWAEEVVFFVVRLFSLLMLSNSLCFLFNVLQGLSAEELAGKYQLPKWHIQRESISNMENDVSVGFGVDGTIEQQEKWVVGKFDIKSSVQ